MILKTIFVLCLTLEIFGAEVVVEETQPTVIYCQRVLDKEVSFGHHSLIPMTFEERTHGYECAFRHLWQKLTPPTSGYVNIVRSLTKFAGWSSAANTVMKKVDCTYDNLLTHIDSASAVAETPSASRNLVVAKARLMRLRLESRMAEKTIEAYDAADTNRDRLQMYMLLNSVIDGAGVKVRFIEMAQLVSVCGYSPYGERLRDLSFAKETIERYFDVSPRGKRHFNELGIPIPRTHAVPALPHARVIPVPYVFDDGEMQRARTTLKAIDAEKYAIEPSVALHVIAAPAVVAPFPSIVVVLPVAVDLAEDNGEEVARPQRRHAETDDTDDDEEVTRPPQRRRITLTDQQKKDVETYLNAGWTYSRIAGILRCSIHGVMEEEAALLSKNG